MTQDELKALIEDLRLNHEYCPKEVILQAADELEALAQPEQDGDCKKCKDGCPACDARKIPNDLL